MSPKPDTWMLCPDTPRDHYLCGAASSSNAYRFAQAEIHFCRAIELVEAMGLADVQLSGELGGLLAAHGHLLEKMGRPHDAIAVYERRLALKRFPGEDRDERRATAYRLAELKAEISAANPEA